MIDYIITAKHYGGSAKKYITNQQVKIMRRKGITITIKGMDSPVGTPIRARIWQGQWIADCEHCNNAMFVDPDEPIFFCFGCLNRKNGGTCRPVVFPEQREEIERLILARPVNDVAGLTDLERAGLARAILSVEIDGVIHPLCRSWNPNETVEDLQKQNEVIEQWRNNGV